MLFWPLPEGRLPGGDKAKALVVRRGPSSVVETSSVRRERLRLLACRSGAPAFVVPSLKSKVRVTG